MPVSAIQIYIIDDEETIRTAYARLALSAKMRPRTFACVDEFMSERLTDDNACVVSDIRLPGTSGLVVPGLLLRTGRRLPVIFTTAHDTQETRELAQKVGAAGFFRKPVDGQALLDAIVFAVGRAASPPDPPLA